MNVDGGMKIGNSFRRKHNPITKRQPFRSHIRCGDSERERGAGERRLGPFAMTELKEAKVLRAVAMQQYHHISYNVVELNFPLLFH